MSRVHQVEREAAALAVIAVVETCQRADFAVEDVVRVIRAEWVIRRAAKEAK